MGCYIRIDDRLIHGQIVASWISYLECKEIVVADDKAAMDTFQQALLKIAVPGSVKLQILKVSDAAIFLSKLSDSDNVLLILRDVDSALALVEAGYKPNMINVGNVGAAKGKKQYFKSICLDDDDIEKYHKLNNAGVELITQVVPNEKSIDFFELVKN